MWLDEFITLHLARLNSLHELWHALAVGADPNPPVTYILVHWCREMFGDHEWAYRAPAAIGCWIGLVSLFAYLKRRVSGTWAMFGCLVWMAMAAFDYSFESRSYAIFYGLAMLAFLCWTTNSRLIEPESRAMGCARRDGSGIGCGDLNKLFCRARIYSTGSRRVGKDDSACDAPATWRSNRVQEKQARATLQSAGCD